MIVSLSVGFKTDVGRKRENNEDSYAVLRRDELDKALDGLFVVADGMGGGRHGDVASGIVAQTVPEMVLESVYERNGRNGSLDTARLMQDTLSRANHRVWMRGAERSELRGMGTTCVAAMVKDDILTIGNVGDSRAYLLREGALRQITEDHSEIWQEVKAGRMTREQARKSRHRNAITQAMGLRSEVKPDVEQIPLEEGDTVLLCSDGLTTEVGDAEIARILATVPDAQDACDRLVTAALRHGGGDNITVVVLRYGAFTPIALPDPMPEEDEDDLPTDPNAEWRRGGANLPMPRDDAEDDSYYEDRGDFREENEETRAARGGGGLLIALLILLLLIAIAEGAALYIALSHRTVSPPPIIVNKNEAPELRPTDGKLNYYPPASALTEPVLNSFLTIDPDGNVYAISAKDGKMLKLDKQGNVKAVSPTRTRRARDEFASDTTSSPFPPVYIAFDPSGNRYESNPKYGCIDKFKGETRILQIDKGQLKEPGSLVVNNIGTIYVVDGSHLYRIDAFPPETPKPTQE